MLNLEVTYDIELDKGKWYHFGILYNIFLVFFILIKWVGSKYMAKA